MLKNVLEIYVVSVHERGEGTAVQTAFASLAQAEEFAGRQLCHLAPSERLHIRATPLHGLPVLPKSNPVVESVLPK